jgi:competence protein ComEC
VSNLRAWILEQLDAERGRWMLWLPVALGLGIAIYYELPTEPALWLGPASAAGSLLVAVFAPAGSLARALAIGAVAASSGLALVAWRTASLAAPTLTRPLFSLNVEGRVADIQRLPEGVRVVLEAVRLRGNGVPPPEMMPAKVRVTLNRGAPPLVIGDRLLVLANLSPPAGPAAPGAFDFQRVAWYQQLGAVGYALGPATVIERGRPAGFVRAIDALRAELAARILHVLPGPAGGVVAALLVGEQTAVDKDVAQAMRDSGLAHILSISGLHIVFVVGLVMGIVRYGIALVPPLALRSGCQEGRRRARADGRALLHGAGRCAGAGAARLRDGGLSRCWPSCSTAPRCRCASSPGRRSSCSSSRRSRSRVPLSRCRSRPSLR